MTMERLSDAKLDELEAIQPHDRASVSGSTMLALLAEVRAGRERIAKLERHLWRYHPQQSAASCEVLNPHLCLSFDPDDYPPAAAGGQEE